MAIQVHGGTGFIDGTNGPLWKQLHRLIAPALMGGAVRAYVPFILDEGAKLHARLGSLSGSGDPLDMAHEIGRLPFEVVTRVIFGDGLDAEVRARLYEDSREFFDTVGTVQGRSPTPLHAWWLRRTGLRRMQGRIESVFTEAINKRHEKLTRQHEEGLLSKSAASTILDRFLVDAVMEGRPLDHALRRLIIDK